MSACARNEVESIKDEKHKELLSPFMVEVTLFEVLID